MPAPHHLALHTVTSAYAERFISSMIRKSVPFDITPIGLFGAVIEGLDLSELAGAGTVRQLRRALATFQLLLFRGQVISPRDQLRLTEYFGNLESGIARRPTAHQVEGYPDLLYIRNTPDSPTLDYGSAWHSDGLAYTRIPHGATVLRCIDCPADAGDTLFANQYEAYDAVPEHLRESLDGLYWYLPPIDYSEVPDGKGLVQPLFRMHPETRRNYIYHAPQACQIRGMGHADSKRITDVIRRCQVREDLVYHHSWQPQDVLVWENCTLLHKRADTVDFATQGLRALHRSATSGQWEATECEAAPQCE
jgi:alpha-ketoglutarate-dependent taurine dioxygenase